MRGPRRGTGGSPGPGCAGRGAKAEQQHPGAAGGGLRLSAVFLAGPERGAPGKARRKASPRKEGAGYPINTPRINRGD